MSFFNHPEELSDHYKICKWKLLPAISVNEECHHRQVTTVSPTVSPEGLRMETNGLPATKPLARAPAPTGTPWGIQKEKEQDPSPWPLRCR